MAPYNTLTDTTSQTEWTVARPNNNHITFSFDTDASRPGLTRITLPPGSTWTTSPHWHETHTEYVRVVRGRIIVILNGQSKIVTAEGGPQTIDKFVVHEWMRADRGSVEKDEGDVVVEEWTDPDDGSKQVFFRNLLSVIGDESRCWKSWVPLQILVTCDAYDNYAVMVPSAVPQSLSYMVTHSAFMLARLTGIVCGLAPWYKEYTPENLRTIAARPGGVGEVKKE